MFSNNNLAFNEFFDQKHKYNWDIKFNASERQKRSIQEQAALLQSHAKQICGASVVHWKF